MAPRNIDQSHCKAVLGGKGGRFRSRTGRRCRERG